MARIRTIKPEFPQSESMGRVSREARLSFILLWTLADDAGRTRGDPRMLASLLFPYDRDAPDLIGEWIAELEREGCVMRYRVSGSTYIQIVNWTKHQRINRPSGPQCPAPTSDANSVSAHGGLSEDSVRAHGGLTAGSGSGSRSGSGPRPGGGPGEGTGRSPSLATSSPRMVNKGEPKRGAPSLPVEVLADQIRLLIDGELIAADDVDGIARVMHQPPDVVRASLRELHGQGQP